MNNNVYLPWLTEEGNFRRRSYLSYYEKFKGGTMSDDNVNHPAHYTQHPSGIECIEITRHMGFNLGNAMKYIWRADLKAKAIEDLEKAIFYIQDEIEKMKKGES